MVKRICYSHWLRCGQDGSSHAVQTLNVRLKLGTVGLLVPGTVAVTRELGGLERDVVCENIDTFVLSTANIAAVEDVVTKLEEKLAKNKNVVKDGLEALSWIHQQNKLQQKKSSSKDLY